MEPILRELSIGGAEVKKEKGFFASRIFKKDVAPAPKEDREDVAEEFSLQSEKSKSEEILSSMDSEARLVYAAIPESGACPLESICSESLPLRTVMKYLLKLEIKGLVTMLPGERVQRADQ